MTDEQTVNTEPVKVVTPQPRGWVLERNLAYLLYRTNWFRLVLAGLSGLLLIISFPPLSYGLFGWVALVPLLLAVFSSPSWKIAALCGLVSGVVFYSFSLFFMVEVFKFFGLLMANSLSIYLVLFCISGWLAARCFGLGRAFFLLPIFWTAIEYYRAEVYDLKFPWLALGYSQAKLFSLIQVCDIIGVYGLTFLLVTANALFAWFLLERIRKRRWVSAPPAAVGFILLALLIYGATRPVYQPSYQRADQAYAIPVAVVQDISRATERYIKATSGAIDSWACISGTLGRPAIPEPMPGASPRPGGGRPTLVVWPELALEKALSDPAIRSKIEALAMDKNIYLFLGTVEAAEEIAQFHNLVAVFSPEGKLLGTYAKRVPVPFIETVVTPGRGWGVFETPLAKVGVLICYEAGFSDIATQLVRKKGVEVLVVPTLDVVVNDSVPFQHHASMIPFRAIETRRPILRSAVQGISMIVHPSGKIEGQLDYLATGVLRADIFKSDELTFYVQYGYAFAPICLIFYSLFVIIIILLIILSRIPGGRYLVNRLRIRPF